MRGMLSFAVALSVVTLVASEAAPAAGPGFVRHSIGGLPVSVALPTSWQGVVVPTSVTPAVLKRLVAIDPAASMLANPYVAQAGVRFIGNEPELKGHFGANVNLIVQPLHNLTLRAWFFGGSSAAMQYVGTTTPISGNGTPGLHYQSTKVQKYGTTPLLTDAYAFAYGGRVFDFTYTSLAADAHSYLPAFAASGRSIRFGTT